MKITTIFFASLMILLYSNSFAQYQMSLRNDTLVSGNQYEFDVFIKSIAGKINLTSYQIILTYNEAIANGGNLEFSYISGSSQLSNIPDINVGIIDDIGNQKNLVAGSSYGSDTISASNFKVGTFKITNSIPFPNNVSADIGWGFNGFIRTEVNINDTSKTNPTNNINSLANSFLPVELVSFSAEINTYTVNLEWTTKTELNNYGFEVEKSINKSSFQKIGFIKGSGTTTLQHNYSFADKNISGGTKFSYRLKQIDFAGQFEYSKEVEVEIIPKQYTLYQNYPNPFNPSTTIKFDLPQAEEVNLTVYNILGERIITLVDGLLDAGYHLVVFNGENLASGTYFYRFHTPNFVQIKKMLLLK
jgi:Secretion system C-terminal sorting domain